MAFDLGDTVALTADCHATGGQLVNAATVTLTITALDGTTSTPIVPTPPTVVGRYRYDVVPVPTGRHLVRWVFTGPADAYTDAFDVDPADIPLVLSLEGGKRQLNITTTDHDEEIRDYLTAVTDVIEALCGPVVTRTIVEVHEFRCALVLVLRQPPILSVRSVTPIRTAGTAPAVSDLDVDSDTGTLRRKDCRWLLGGPWRVTYTAGRPVVPAGIRLAARIILDHLWRTQNGADGLPALAHDDYAVTQPIAGLGFAVPNRALELVDRNRRTPEVG
ncbi:phage gp6-like head-tail connector protein [Actinocrispum wychmicini]|uniref:phage gp6-like head-tail connector protein n=1 Tax=Actinocrispum wychmicini TaxID=1213861 RepID=UPI001051DC31|nr:phage gp6-like head-tail connector protein [Actinocrispum wychmicini]